MSDQSLGIRVERSLGSSRSLNGPQIIAVGGGKGGVGKTVLSASLGIGIAMLNKRVVVIDADLGGADLHTVMGIEQPKFTVVDFFNHSYSKLENVLIQHPRFENVRILGGANGALGMANIPASRKGRFLRHIKKLDTDFVIMDLGAGSSYNVLDFFLAADQGIVVVQPNPLSIHESYNFVKMALFRYIARTLRGHDGTFEAIKQAARVETHRKSTQMVELLRVIHEQDSILAEKIVSFLNRFHPMILINHLMHSRDEQNVLSIRSAARELLSVEMDYIGAVHRDETVLRALNQMIPFIHFDPKCRASRDLMNIVMKKLFEKRRFESFQTGRLMRKTLDEIHPVSRDAVICSVRCQYWEDCEFRKGGFPCELHQLSGIQGFRGDQS